NENTLSLTILILRSILTDLQETLKKRWRYLIPAESQSHNHMLIPDYQDIKFQDFRHSDGFECYQVIKIGSIFDVLVYVWIWTPVWAIGVVRVLGFGCDLGHYSRNPLVHTGILESDSEVEVTFDETPNLRISTSGKDGSDKCYGTNSLLEQWRDSYPDNDDYHPYDDDMNPLVHTGILESDSEVEVTFDETPNLRISTSGKDGSDKCYGTNSLLEQWRDSYPDNDDYHPYDDDMYENHDFFEHLQSIFDDLDITVHGRKKK
nr:hypothetical protein [Tanacetum cinerariifolium]